MRLQDGSDAYAVARLSDVGYGALFLVGFLVSLGFWLIVAGLAAVSVLQGAESFSYNGQALSGARGALGAALMTVVTGAAGSAVIAGLGAVVVRILSLRSGLGGLTITVGMIKDR